MKWRRCYAQNKALGHELTIDVLIDDRDFLCDKISFYGELVRDNRDSYPVRLMISGLMDYGSDYEDGARYGKCSLRRGSIVEGLLFHIDDLVEDEYELTITRLRNLVEEFTGE